MYYEVLCQLMLIPQVSLKKVFWTDIRYEDVKHMCLVILFFLVFNFPQCLGIIRTIAYFHYFISILFHKKWIFKECQQKFSLFPSFCFQIRYGHAQNLENTFKLRAKVHEGSGNVLFIMVNYNIQHPVN